MRYQSKTVFSCNRWKRLIKICAPEILATVVYLHNKRLWIIDTNFCNPFAMRRNYSLQAVSSARILTGRELTSQCTLQQYATVSALLTELLSLTDLRV